MTAATFLQEDSYIECTSMTPDPRSQELHSTGQRPDKPESQEIVLSEDLLRGRNQVLIRHGNDVYRLFRTKNNKLVLQK
ncbi:MAG: hemin uptake protein HemP [Planctomycetaceae bacterium]